MTMPWKKLLCPIDFSEPARAAMTAAVELARHFDAELTLFHSYQLPGYTLPEGSVVASPKMLQDLADQAEAHLEEWRQIARQLGAPRVLTAKAIGDPALEVVELAREGAFDLIVLGTHGRTGIRHALLGSITERVVRHARCPVLTIHPEGRPRA
jgi:nucleotide-binding universal stress UspA family protein